MNRLAIAENSLLVPQAFLEENSLRVGDSLTIVVNIENLASVYTEYMIVGTFQYFPNTTNAATIVVSNLDYLSTLTGLTVAHDIWLKTDPEIDHDTLKKNLESKFSIQVEQENDVRALVAEEQGRMERVGIFGTLSIGFLATAVMAILGLLIYSYASLQERAYRLAVLNAIGLSRRQIMTQVILEYIFLVIMGAALGAFIGLVAANLFVPFFQFTGEAGEALPPLLPIIANTQLRNLSLIFGLTVIGLEFFTVSSLLNRRLTQILKRVWI